MYFFGIRLALTTRGEDQLVLRVPTRFRIVMIIITVVILGGTIAVTPGGPKNVFEEANLLPLLLLSLSLLSALYRDRWLFDKERDLLERQFGLLFLYKRNRMRVSDLQRVEVTEYVRGSWPGSAPVAGGENLKGRGQEKRSFVMLTLVTKDGREFKLENYSGPKAGIVINMGRQLSDYLQIAFISKTSRG